MKASTSLALIGSAVAISSVNGGSLLAAVLRPRVVDEIWRGINITAAVFEVYNSISQPTCNSTDHCVQLATVPRCLELEGTAGCWCTLHDPIHYCANCMTSPTDDTTNPDRLGPPLKVTLTTTVVVPLFKRPLTLPIRREMGTNNRASYERADYGKEQSDGREKIKDDPKASPRSILCRVKRPGAT
ncbi:hypothetical protein M407DRAFT_5639 [Tulasnella calospora MUT 4182]|uniref:Extracellular membrane protein CFEM domain-containing protein n=1 Tax=Tulasnella calospora MUT 4182 TaxID=1051891 RepID=A0A0C3QPY4_9AGAM|nr:hypothetical protein M407DRAFT_5639 [Tulasnella calospora MUT 4182]